MYVSTSTMRRIGIYFASAYRYANRTAHDDGIHTVNEIEKAKRAKAKAKRKKIYTELTVYMTT